MQANWSLILNVLLLIGVFIAIGRLIRARRQSLNPISYQPSLGQIEPKYNGQMEAKNFDDIIAVRKVSPNFGEGEDVRDIPLVQSSRIQKIEEPSLRKIEGPLQETNKSLMIFLLAKGNRQLAGYELLQTLLAAGLRFGEGNLFHRHQQANGQGPVLCSLAAATASGVFDLQNMGAFSVRGLCLFMQASGNPVIDLERFQIMYDTAKQLADGLDTYLLDDARQPFTEASVARYHKMLNLQEHEELLELA
jgi:cell division protein ZipA